jgi:hypothetical protein
MEFVQEDFNGADELFGGPSAAEWADIDAVLRATPIFLQGSDQRSRQGKPIFDPKATNAHLTAQCAIRDWKAIPVPDELTAYGVDWDGGKNTILAEWQFSNYPFLWNNIIRTEAALRNRVNLPHVGVPKGLIVVTKCGMFPASNSTLYYEQALAQIRPAIELGVFATPIRLVGLSILEGAREIQATWSEYGNARYDRAPVVQRTRRFEVALKKGGKYGVRKATFREQ